MTGAAAVIAARSMLITKVTGSSSPALIIQRSPPRGWAVVDWAVADWLGAGWLVIGRSPPPRCVDPAMASPRRGGVELALERGQRAGPLGQPGALGDLAAQLRLGGLLVPQDGGDLQRFL